MYLTRDPIHLQALIDAIADSSHGGVSAFLGVVRNHHQGRPVLGLDYTAYEPMAEAVCAEILAEAAGRWPVRLALRHRLGSLGLGEVAVAVVAAGGHRGEAFEASRYVIEELKRRVPIWKRERYQDGTEEWVDPTAAAVVARQGSAGEGATR
jgi:molybdopterin synthase catalytic subunit